MRLARARVHFIGIGGIGMCGLAELLHNMGAKVAGSDAHANAQTERLSKMGVSVFIGHRADQVASSEVVVYSSAIKSDNVEFREARRLGIPLIARAEALAEIMRLKRGVAIAGSHGKTTTTSLTASVFLAAHLDPTIVVGGRLDLIKSTAQLGKGDWLIAEADESDGSFLRLSPELAVITNIDSDHLDHFGSLENLEKAFYEFALRIPFYGALIACGDDESIQRTFRDFPKRLITYGFGANNDYILKGANGQYEVFHRDQRVGDLRVPIPGQHNALNALASVLVGLQAGMKWDVCHQGISNFQGVDRRFQKKGEWQGVEIFDDYGHHPTEVRATLLAFREKFPKKRLVVLFQPHRFSRTQLCWDDFLTSFKSADQVYLLDIYPAGESAIPNITAGRLASEIDHPHCECLGSRQQAFDVLNKSLKSGDVLITLGAGDVWKVGEELLGAYP